MTVAEADKIIRRHLAAGLISEQEAIRLNRLVRRTGGYGHEWSWENQAAMRDVVLGNFIA